MRFAGIDIGAERHAVALVDEAGRILHKPESVGRGSCRVPAASRALLGDPRDCLIAMEATGHYWKNLFSWLTAEGFSIALDQSYPDAALCGGRTATHQDRSCRRLGIARFAAQKRPQFTRLSDHFARNSATSSTYVSALFSTLETACAIFIERSISHSQSLPVTFAVSTRRLLPLSCLVIPRRAPFSPQRYALAAICFDGRRRVGRLFHAL